MNGPTQPHGNPHRPKAAAILIVPVAVALVLTLFAWPNARLEPRGLPVGVAGPAAATAAMEERLGDDAFDVHRYPDETAARRAIEDREVYGAFVASSAGPKALTASAASPAVAQMITHAASEGPGGGQAPMPVEDVVAASPAGGALASSVLPLVLAGILTGLAAAALGRSAPRRAGLVVVGSLLAGVVSTAIVQSWLGVIEGDWMANAAALTLTVLAIAAIVAGLEALLGKVGAAVAALTMVLIGNPFSGVGSAPEMLPQPVGGIGQLLPPGAGGNLLRSTGFFDGAAAGEFVLVLGVWTLLGLGALFVAAARERRAPAPAQAAEAAA
jgi:hypothetical protein